MRTPPTSAPRIENDIHTDYDARVARGISLLTETYLVGVPDPLGRIGDPDGIDMVSVTRDVLGRIYGTYDLGLDQLDLTDPQAVALGFSDAWRRREASAGKPLPVRKPTVGEVAA